MRKEYDIDNECIRRYFNDLKKIKPLPKEEETILLKRYKLYNDIEAKNKIIESNLKYVITIASKYRGNGVPFSDLISEANNGLIEAIDKFDTGYDIKFLTYAKWWILSSIKKTIEKSPSKMEIELNLYTDRDDNDDDCTNPQKNESIENEYCETMDDTYLGEYIKSLMNDLTQSEKEVIELCFGMNCDKSHTFTEIGEIKNLSSERIRKIYQKAMKKIRASYLLSYSAR